MMARRPRELIPHSNGIGTGGAALSQSLEPYLHVPPGRVVDLKLVDGDRSVHLHVDTRSDGGGGGGNGGGEGSGSGSRLREVFVAMAFKPCQTVDGLDFGRQMLLPHYPLHVKWHEEHGLATYSQSERCKRVQNVYHVATMGLGTSVKKCIILLMNTKEDVAVVGRSWPDTVAMLDFGDLVLARTMDYVFCREKIQKGSFTFYLYYVKKHGSETQRLESWLHLISAVGTLENVADWAKVVCAGMGQAANLALGFL